MESSAVRSCGSCLKPLPEDASFCHRCGAATPTGTDSTSGVSTYAPSATALELENRRHALQAAVGNRCEVRGLLGRGGFAEVYLAWDPRLKRELAIKTLRPDIMASTDTLERFQREAEAIAKLRHPNVVPIYTVGESAGIAYYTMPRVDGETLSSALKRDGKFAVAETVRILREAASALGSAHRAGIVHRDIKPENIMLEGPDRRVLVMDFGISKTLDAVGGLTATGMLVGTPQFMSPEQALGERDLGPASDQYSLAVVGYQMLTGRLPFEADTLQSLMFKQATAAAVPLLEIDPALPRAVAEPIERALSKDPSQRYPAVEEFGAALAAAVERSGAVGAGWSRQLPDMRVRVAAMRAELPGWKHPLTIVAVAGALAFLALQPRTVHGPAYELAAQRDEAIFAARTFLANRGIPGPYVTSARPLTQITRYRYFESALGVAEAGRIAADQNVWYWQVRLLPREGESWHFEVGPESRIVHAGRAVPNDADAAAVVPAVAESIAVQRLVARGWNPDDLLRLPDSTISRFARADLMVRWERPRDHVIREGQDTAFAEIRVLVTGDGLHDYNEIFRTPGAFQADPPRHWVYKVANGAGLLIFAGGLIAAIAVIVRRHRSDELQWRVGTAAGTATAVCLLSSLALFQMLEMRFPLADEAAAGERWGILLGVLIMSIGAGGLGFVSAVAGESLLAERRPSAVLGIRAILAHGIRAPELAMAAGGGIIGAALALGGEALVAAVTGLATGSPASVGIDGAFGQHGWARLLLGVGSSLVVAASVWFAQAAALSLWKRQWLSVLLPALVALLLFAANPDPLTRFGTPLTVLFLSWTMWRFGVAAGVVMAVAHSVLPSLLLLVRYGGEPLAGTILLALALAAAFPVLGFLAHRRATRTVA